MSENVDEWRHVQCILDLYHERGHRAEGKAGREGSRMILLLAVAAALVEEYVFYLSHFQLPRL